MTCKDCIHYEACCEIGGKLQEHYMNKAEEVDCHHLKDKSRLVEIPCKVGDTVYSVVDCETPFIDEGYVASFAVGLGGIEIYTRYECGLTYWYWENDIGKRFFFTIEEAEEALERMEEKKK